MKNDFAGRGNDMTMGLQTQSPSSALLGRRSGSGPGQVRKVEDRCCLNPEMGEQRHEETDRRGQLLRKGEGGSSRGKGRTNPRLCILLSQLPHPTTRCHQTQNLLETLRGKQPGTLILKEFLVSEPRNYL